MSEDSPQFEAGSEWRSRLLELPRFSKRVILISFDFLLLALALWIALSIRYNTAYVPPNPATLLVLISGPAITIATFTASGLYRFVTRYLGYRGHTRIIGCIWLSVLIWSLLVFLSGQLGVPRSVVLGYGLLASLLIAGSREVAAMILESTGIRLSELPVSVERRPVIIFGAGQLGVLLLDALRRSNNRSVVAFVDTEPSLWRQYVAGIKVHRPDKLATLIERQQVKEILVALPDDRRRERRRILKDLQALPVEVLILPGVEDVT
ncbi:MAG: nucleoside-diphosphate sugar epimerase/dehydratase, partial [Hyphomicrobium sp.]